MIQIFLLVLLLLIFVIFIQPLIVLYMSWRNTNFSDDYLSQNLPYNTDLSGFEGLPSISKGEQLIGQAADSQKTCENGFFIGAGSQMVNVDCTSICNATSADQFVYRHITSNKVIINNRYLQPGSWCLPTSLARCNLNISTAIKSLGRYECISRYPRLLGGQFGNDIVGCAPLYEFRDNLRKLIYTNTAPSTLVIGGDLDELLPNSNKYRYTCNVPTEDDDTIPTHSNTQFSAFGRDQTELGDRFQLYYDTCGFFDEGGRLIRGKCQCSELEPSRVVKPLYDGVNKQPYDLEPICSSCTSGYGIVDERLPQYGSKYGVSIGINCVDPERIEYYKSLTIERNGVLPCGVKTIANMRETPNSRNYGCHRALLNVTNTYTPEMLQRING